MQVLLQQLGGGACFLDLVTTPSSCSNRVVAAIFRVVNALADDCEPVQESLSTIGLVRSGSQDVSQSCYHSVIVQCHMKQIHQEGCNVVTSVQAQRLLQKHLESVLSVVLCPTRYLLDYCNSEMSSNQC